MKCPPSRAAAQNRIEQAEVDEETARREVQRMDRGYELGAVPEIDVLEACSDARPRPGDHGGRPGVTRAAAATPPARDNEPRRDQIEAALARANGVIAQAAA